MFKIIQKIKVPISNAFERYVDWTMVDPDKNLFQILAEKR